MDSRIAGIVDMIRKLEGDLEVELARRRLEFCYKIDHGKVEFEEKTLKFHRQLRSPWLGYLLDARPSVLLTAPFIYALIVPFALLDLSVSTYQYICFRVYGIPRVRRSDHLVFDRGHLAYLNWFERFNCSFCSYANGVVGYVREVAARTEQYWCPIKHARRILGAPERYQSFADYGDGAAYARELAESRRQLQAQTAQPRGQPR